MADQPIILGQQLASAREAESERIARGDSGESPLRPFDRYDELNGDVDLHDPVPLPLDNRLADLCRVYEMQNQNERAATRRSLSMDDFYTLFTFANRAAVFGWRTRDPRWFADGLTAVAMVEMARIDWRDSLGPPFLVYAIFHQIGLDATKAFKDAAAISEPEISELLLSFGNRPPEHATLKAAGYAMVNSPSGPGLVRRSCSPYQPSVALDQVILRLAQLLREQNYSPSVEIATELPDVWLSKIDDHALGAALATVVAGAMAHAKPFPAVCPDYASQGIMAFLVETANYRGAEALIRIAHKKQLLNNDFAMVAAQCGRLFCMFVARNFILGGKSLETPQSILRFQSGIEAILQACPQGEGKGHQIGVFERLRGFGKRFIAR